MDLLHGIVYYGNSDINKYLVLSQASHVVYCISVVVYGSLILFFFDYVIM